MTNPELVASLQGSMSKQCSCCCKRLALSEFHRSCNTSDGHHTICKACRLRKAKIEGWGSEKRAHRAKWASIAAEAAKVVP